MKNLIISLIEELKERIDAEVPEKGHFEMLEVTTMVDKKSVAAEKIALEVMQPPKGIDDRDIIRGLKIVAYRAEDAMEILIATGTKQELLEKLNGKDLILVLEECVFKLDDSLRNLK